MNTLYTRIASSNKYIPPNLKPIKKLYKLENEMEIKEINKNPISELLNNDPVKTVFKDPRKNVNFNFKLNSAVVDHILGFIRNCHISSSNAEEIIFLYGTSTLAHGLELIFYISSVLEIDISFRKIAKDSHIILPRTENAEPLVYYEITMKTAKIITFLRESAKFSYDNKNVMKINDYRCPISIDYIRGLFESYGRIEDGCCILVLNKALDSMCTSIEKTCNILQDAIKTKHEMPYKYGKKDYYIYEYRIDNKLSANFMWLLYGEYNNQSEYKYKIPNIYMYEQYLKMCSIKYDEYIEFSGPGKLINKQTIYDDGYLLHATKMEIWVDSTVILNTEINIKMPTGYHWQFTPINAVHNGFIISSAFEDLETKTIMVVLQKIKEVHIRLPIEVGYINPIKIQHLPCIYKNRE